MSSDPCLKCPLPDCDETAKGCEMRRIYASYCSKVRRKLHDEITAEEREANNRWFEIYQLERYALAAEGVRPYRRSGSAWTGDEARPAQ